MKKRTSAGSDSSIPSVKMSEPWHLQHISLMLLGTLVHCRHTSWYMPRKPSESTLGWLNSASSGRGPITTGVYMCCGGFNFNADGSVQTVPAASVLNETAALLSSGLRVHYVAGISNISVASGSWASGIPAAVATAVAGGFDGYIVDYEPATNYTAAHAQAYATFLTAFASALHSAGKELGFDTAGWGILDYWDLYRTTGADIATSMTPTYEHLGNGSTARAFVLGQISGGMPLASIGSGVGTMIANSTGSGYQPEWWYNWTQPTLTEFSSWLAGTAGVQRLDFWRADMDHDYPVEATEPWVFDVAAAWVAAP